MIGIIKRTFSYLNRCGFIQLYKALVRPHLEYGNIIWFPHLKRQSSTIEKVQRRATRLLFEPRSLNCEERMRHVCLPSLKYRQGSCLRRGGTWIWPLHGRIEVCSLWPLNWTLGPINACKLKLLYLSLISRLTFLHDTLWYLAVES